MFGEDSQEVSHKRRLEKKKEQIENSNFRREAGEFEMLNPIKMKRSRRGLFRCKDVEGQLDEKRRKSSMSLSENGERAIRPHTGPLRVRVKLRRTV